MSNSLDYYLGLSLQKMTKAEYNRPIPKLFSNWPSASAAEVFGVLREPIIFFENNILNCNPNPPSSPPLEIKLLEN